MNNTQTTGMTTRNVLNPPVKFEQPTEAAEFLASDIRIPRLLLMQGLSPLVTARKAQLGDIVRSSTQTKIGDPETPLEVVPLKSKAIWINMEEVGGKFKYRNSEPRHAKNELMDFEYTVNGVNWRRMKAYELYALLPSDVAEYTKEIKAAVDSGNAPDLNKTILPVVLTIQSTSFKHAGRDLAGFFGRVQANARQVPGLVPYKYVLTLFCETETNAKGTYYVWKMKPGTKALTDQAAQVEASKWAKILGSQEVKVDEEGLDSEEGTTESVDV